MRVEHLWRIREGRKTIKKGSDSPLAVALVPGYQPLRDFIIALERTETIEPSHPGGSDWQFQFRLAYRPSGELLSLRLEILPELSKGNRVPAIRLDRGSTLSLEFLSRYIREHLPVCR